MPNDSIPEIITVNSEALEQQIRILLPSQRGFGSELQASNVITPIIDLTKAAEGAGLPVDMQTALAFGSQTSGVVENGTSTIISGTGFFRIYGVANCNATASANAQADININDGSTNKQLFQAFVGTSSALNSACVPFDFVVFTRAGDTVNAVSGIAGVKLQFTVRQIATINGTLVVPNGFVAE